MMIGDLVWASLEGYPTWPAQIIDPTAVHLNKLNLPHVPSDEFVVLFFNDEGHFSAIPQSELKPFTLAPIKRYIARGGPYKSQLRHAITLAKAIYDDGVRKPQSLDAKKRSSSHLDASPAPHKKQKVMARRQNHSSQETQPTSQPDMQSPSSSEGKSSKPKRRPRPVALNSLQSEDESQQSPPPSPHSSPTSPKRPTYAVKKVPDFVKHPRHGSESPEQDLPAESPPVVVPRRSSSNTHDEKAVVKPAGKTILKPAEATLTKRAGKAIVKPSKSERKTLSRPVASTLQSKAESPQLSPVPQKQVKSNAKTNKLKATDKPGRSSEPEPKTESTKIPRRERNSTKQKQKRSQPISDSLRVPRKTRDSTPQKQKRAQPASESSKIPRNSLSLTPQMPKLTEPAAETAKIPRKSLTLTPQKPKLSEPASETVKIPVISLSSTPQKAKHSESAKIAGLSLRSTPQQKPAEPDHDSFRIPRRSVSSTPQKPKHSTPKPNSVRIPPIVLSSTTQKPEPTEPVPDSFRIPRRSLSSTPQKPKQNHAPQNLVKIPQISLSSTPQTKQTQPLTNSVRTPPISQTCTPPQQKLTEPAPDSFRIPHKSSSFTPQQPKQNQPPSDSVRIPPISLTSTAQTSKQTEAFAHVVGTPPLSSAVIPQKPTQSAPASGSVAIPQIPLNGETHGPSKFEAPQSKEPTEPLQSVPKPDTQAQLELKVHTNGTPGKPLNGTPQTQPETPPPTHPKSEAFRIPRKSNNVDHESAQSQPAVAPPRQVKIPLSKPIKVPLSQPVTKGPPPLLSRPIIKIPLSKLAKVPLSQPNKKPEASKPLTKSGLETENETTLAKTGARVESMGGNEKSNGDVRPLSQQQVGTVEGTNSEKVRRPACMSEMYARCSTEQLNHLLHFNMDQLRKSQKTAWIRRSELKKAEQPEQVVKSEKELEARCRRAVRAIKSFAKSSGGNEEAIGGKEKEVLKAIKSLSKIYFDPKKVNIRGLCETLRPLVEPLHVVSSTLQRALGELVIRWADLMKEFVAPVGSEKTKTPKTQKEKRGRMVAKPRSKFDGSASKVVNPPKRGKKRSIALDADEDDKIQVVKETRVKTKKRRLSVSRRSEARPKEEADATAAAANKKKQADRIKKFTREQFIAIVVDVLGKSEGISWTEVKRTSIAETLEICITPRKFENADENYRKCRNVVAIMRIIRRPMEGRGEDYAELRRLLVGFSKAVTFDEAKKFVALCDKAYKG